MSVALQHPQTEEQYRKWGSVMIIYKFFSTPMARELPRNNLDVEIFTLQFFANYEVPMIGTLRLIVVRWCAPRLSILGIQY